jgi:hypothetical protein
VRPYEFMPGVPAAGHISGGFWHPGRIDGCPKCPEKAEVWRQGYVAGHSRAMRKMSDEPGVEPAPNPYEEST